MSVTADWTPILDRVRPPGASGIVRVGMATLVGAAAGLAGGELMTQFRFAVAGFGGAVVLVVPLFAVVTFASPDWTPSRTEWLAALVTLSSLTAAGARIWHTMQDTAAPPAAWFAAAGILIILWAMGAAVTSTVARVAHGE